MQRKLRICAATTALSLCAIPAALADFEDLISRIPGEANALVVVDVDKLMNNPLANSEGWRQKRESAYTDKPLIVPPDASRLVMAALVDLSTMSPIWEVSVMDVNKPPSLAAIARAEGGYVDALAGKAAAWSPINAYFVQLDTRVLGAVAPANRQFAARWAAKKGVLQGAAVSAYLKKAARAVGSGAQIVLAMDLEGATSVAKAGRRLEAETFSSLADAKIDVNALSRLFGSVKGVTLRVEIGEHAIGKGVIEFGQKTAILKKVAKPLLIELLGKNGVQIRDIAAWRFETRGNTITFEGGLTTRGLRRIFSLVDPPTPLDSGHVETAAAETSAGQERETAQAADRRAVSRGGGPTAAASKKYYQTVDRIISRLQDRMGTGAKAASLADSATWTQRDARRIGRLPILNVDPDLLEWGAEVATALTHVSQVFKVGGLHTLSRTSGLTVSGFHVSYSYGSYGRATGGGWNNARYIAGQRKQASFEEKAASTEAAGQIVAALAGSLSRIRIQMTERYQIEF